MRRTFNDLARAAHVGDLVTRSISGHATPRMQAHYPRWAPRSRRAGLRRSSTTCRCAPSGLSCPKWYGQVVRRARRWCALLLRNEKTGSDSVTTGRIS